MGRRSTDVLLAALIPLSILFHLALAPYTKVEESFNIQATHDILTYGLPVGRGFAQKLRDQYDHLTFTGSVPRTFVGPLVLAIVSWPASLILHDGVDKQILVRAVLGLFNAFCLLFFRNCIHKTLGYTAARWFCVFQAGQFHIMYYASRTLPNFFAFGFTTIALGNLLLFYGSHTSPHYANKLNRRALFTLTATGVVFRSEIVLLLGAILLWDIYRTSRFLHLRRAIIPPGLLGFLTGLLFTVPLDSYFWLRFPIWPEFSAFIYNVLKGNSANWGTSPALFYFTSALPRLLFNPMVYLICLPVALIVDYQRPDAPTPPENLTILRILRPVLTFLALYSFQPHKEWRFIIYIIPPILAVASAGAARIWSNRANSFIYRLLALCLVGSTIASFAASFAMASISSVNYPGADALELLHQLHYMQKREQKEVARVHMDILTCMTGVTRFLQIPPPPMLSKLGEQNDDRKAWGPTLWIYDKSEDPDRLLHPAFWDDFDYALAERPETVIGKWEIVGTADGYTRIEVVRPGEEGSLLLWNFEAGEGTWSQQITRLWRAVESSCRRLVTRGWWLKIKLEPKIRVLKKQRQREGMPVEPVWRRENGYAHVTVVSCKQYGVIPDMAPHPGVDTDQIKEKARKDLLDLLEGVRGKKNLVIERSLAGPLGVFAKFSTLQDYGVDKVFFLENNNVDASQRNVIFLARGEKAEAPIAIAEQIKRLQKNSAVEHEFSVVWVPRRTLVANKILEDEGVLGDVSIEEFSLYFVPLEHDVLSLALEDSFSDLYLQKDPTCIFLAAQALMPIQQKYGLFPRIIGKGDNARRLMELLFRMRTEALAGDSISMSKVGMLPSSSIESLIIIDREIDFATCLLTPLTYEGLIDEQFGIRDNQAEIESSIVGPAPGTQASSTTPQQQGLKRKIQLDSSDKIYSQIRDTNIAVTGRILNKVARELKSDYESRHVAVTTSDLREFVNKLPGYQADQQSLKVHTGIAGEIIKVTQSDLFARILEVQQNLAEGNDPASQHDAIEELISRNIPLATVLRLLCLESCVSGGIRQKDLDYFKRLILHAYGYQHILTFDALEKMQLLHPRSSANPFLLPTAIAGNAPAGAKTNYAYLRKALRLIVEEVNEQDPNDIAYVYSGYAPLSVRLVQCVLQKQYLFSIIKTSNPANTSAAHGWQGFDDALKSVRGETFNRVQKGEEHAVKARHMLSGAGGVKTVVVMFLGGISFTEIAALRFVAKREEGKRRLLICTTDVLSGDRMMELAIEKESFGKE